MNNPRNPNSHYETTGPEILSQHHGPLHTFVAGAGSGGTLSGIGKALLEADPYTKIKAAVPKQKETIIAGVGQYHEGSPFPPVFDSSLVSDFVPIADEKALEVMAQLAKQEGLLVGPSSGMAAAAAIKIAEELSPWQSVVTLFADSGERYLNCDLFAKPYSKAGLY